MSLAKRDREFRLNKISYLDFTHIEMDRVLTAFFALLHHNGYPSRLTRKFELTTDAFVAEFLEHPEWFGGFAQHREILERWIETHLMDVVHRGKTNQAIAAPRPLHGFTYRFRNTHHSRDYGAAQHLYELLYGARKASGQNALDQLREFFFQGHDKVTGQVTSTETLDVETQALLRLMDQVEKDAADTTKQRESHPPLCIGAADLLADDVMRLLFYQRFMPRTVMVDYLKILLSFHLALYHLRLLKLLPSFVRRRGVDPVCTAASCPCNPKNGPDPFGDCPHRLGLLVDVANQPMATITKLAGHSADVHYRRIPAFIKAYFATRKLDEFAEALSKTGKLLKTKGEPFKIGEVLSLLEPGHQVEREKFFGSRLYGLIQDSGGETDAELDPALKAITDLGLPEFEAYIEMLVALRGAHHRQYIVKCLDSLLMKNHAGALLAQGRTQHAPRRFVLDSRLLEVLLQIAVLRPGGALGYHTGELRVDELLRFFRARYGIHVDQLPRGDGFGTPSIDERRALRQNVRAFIARLREIGFYRDLSDAYITQTVTPRYTITANGHAQRTEEHPV